MPFNLDVETYMDTYDIPLPNFRNRIPLVNDMTLPSNNVIAVKAVT